MLVGKALGPFKVDKELGSGAMGTVYLAIHTESMRRVAIKVMNPGMSSENANARFEREVSVLKQLNHPNIVRLVASGRYHKAPFYAMEYIEGESLDRVLARRDRFTWEEVVELGRQLCGALQHAHDKGIVHRDLKPSNLMILRDGTLKLTDFGIAKDLDVTALTAANCAVGTAAYMSPEQCKGDPLLTYKSDLYSMGAVFYELVTGEKPFRAETTMDMFLLHVQGQVVRPSKKVDIPVWLDTLICQLLEKKPEQRPLDATMVAQSLDRVAEKVAAKQSAGVDLAKARSGDRPRSGEGLDDTEKDVVRTLAGRKKKKRKEKALHQRRWFQATLLSVLLLAAVAAIVWAFLPPGADKLYAQAEKLALSANPDDQAKALSGPIRDYLRHYGDRDDSATKKVRAWADQLEAGQREQRLDGLVKSRRGLRMIKIEPETDLETQALSAALAQESGDLDWARDNWAKVEKTKSDTDPEARAWAVLAARKQRELAEDAKILADRQRLLLAWYDQMRQSLREFTPETEIDQLALLAQRYEEFGDPYSARRRWLEMKQKFDKTQALRPWGLVAVAKLKDKNLIVQPLAEGEERKAREQLLEAQLAEAKKANTPLSKFICQEIIALYGKNAEHAKQVDEARKLLEEWSGGVKGKD